MSQELEVIEKKKQAYATLGVAVHTTELKLQAQAQALIQRISVLPTLPEHVKEAENTYKEFRSAAVDLQNERKLITSKFDDVCSRLMQPEKSLTAPALAYSEAIIKIKKAEETRVKSELFKEEKKKNIRLWIANEIANEEAQYRIKIADMIAKSYEYSLSNDVKPEAITDYLQKCRVKLKSSDFTMTMKRPHAVMFDAGEFESIEAEFKLPDPIAWQKQFVDELNARFSDYAIAYANKKEALALAKKEADEKAKKDLEEMQNQRAATHMEVVANSQVVTTDMKALKKVYKIQMEETPENAVFVLHTVVGYWGKCSPKIRVKKWFQFSVQNAIVALEAVKNEDNDFNPKGIIFVEVDKL